MFRKNARLICCSAVLLLGMSASVFAQQDSERQAERAAAQALAEEQDRLRAAQRELEAAAREVARLSTRSVAPEVGQLVADFTNSGRKAMLGITIEDVGDGAKVSGVSPGGPAEEAGLKVGDVIVELDGTNLKDSKGSATKVLIQKMADVDPGDAVDVVVVRGGDRETLEVEARPFESRAYMFAFRDDEVAPNFTFNEDIQIGPRMRWRGAGPWSRVELIELTPDLGSYFGTESGILVVRGATMDDIELKDGDVILSIGGREPKSTSHAMRILRSFEEGETLVLEIMRDKRKRTLKSET